jgi:hypothetical protein
MRYNISLIENDNYIRNSIMEILKKEINKALDSTVLKIKDPIIQVIKTALKNEPEYSSLMSGQLRSEFGIDDTSKIDIAINNISNSILIEKKLMSVNNFGLSGGLDLKIINSQDFGGALTDSTAFVNDSERGYNLPWLEWLLLKGNSIIVRNYEVKYGQNSRSRSGDAIMIDSSSNWRVPPEYAGTVRDNWTTRALSRVDSSITKIIQSTFESNI